MNKIILSVSLCCLLILQSCVILFTPINQKVRIVSKTKGTEILLNGKYLGKDSVVAHARLPKSHQIVITKAGHKDKKFYFAPQRLNWRYALDLHPLFLAIDAGTGVKNRLYPRKIVVDELKKLPVKTDDLKYIFVQEAAVDLSKGSSNLKSFKNYKRYLKGTNFRKESWQEPVQYSNTTLSRSLNSMLTKYNFSDSSRSIIKSRVNTTYVNCVLNKIEFIQVRKGYLFQIKLNFKWELYDYYQKKIYETSIESLSDFDTYYLNTDSYGYYSADNTMRDKVDNLIDDVLENSIIDLLNKQEVIALLKTDKEKVARELAERKEIVLSNISAQKKPVNDFIDQVVYFSNGKSNASGCVVSEDGYIVTAVSNLPEKDTFDVVSAGKKYKTYLVRRDDETNLALLKSSLKSSHPFRINQTIPDIADDIFLIAPAASDVNQNSLSKGIISGRRSFNSIDYLQTDASFNETSRGSPLLNTDGELIGLVLGKITGSGLEGLGFCVPARYFAERLKIANK
jgi:hypothetical protein